MRKLFIPSLNELIQLNERIFQIVFENPKIFRNFILNEIDKIIYSENNKEYDYKKVVLKIINPFDLNANDKKNITFLYKYLMCKLDDDKRQKISFIEKNILELLEELTYESEYDLTYLEELDLSKLLTIYQLSFDQNDNIDYLDYLLSYIKINTKVNNYKLVLTNGILNLLTSEEILLLQKELSIMDINLIDISINCNNNIKSRLLVDNDYCIV